MIFQKKFTIQVLGLTGIWLMIFKKYKKKGKTSKHVLIKISKKIIFVI